MNPAILPRMAELGILGINIPVRYDGQGFDYVTLGLVCEELERVDSTLRVVMSVHMGLCSMGLLQWGSEEQKQRFLVPQARGERYTGYGLTEPCPGSDAANIRTTARRDGDMYILNGEKMWISLATKAHHFPVVARTNPDAPKPSAGATCLIRACLEESTAYAQVRETFGVPIARHQLIQQKIAYMALWYDTARLLYLRAGWLKNQGTRNTRETSMAKWYATDHSV